MHLHAARHFLRRGRYYGFLGEGAAMAVFFYNFFASTAFASGRHLGQLA
jgi:hypothetical protein